MTDLNVSLILRLVDKATAPARAAMRALERLGGEGMMRQAAMVSRGSHMMASGLGTMTGAATRGLGVLTDYRTLLAGFGLAAVGREFINTAAEFENFNVQLTNLEGSSDGAKRAMDWIENFATRTPLQMDQTVAAYSKLKAFGIDPMNGTLQALVDTMAATGGGAEKLDGIVLAVGQAFTKGKLQGEEAMQLLERGVPVYDLLAKKMGKTTEEIVEMQAKGKLGREEIALLVEAMGEANKGASENMSKTWDGIISNLWDFWSKFKRQVMGSGLFVYLKGKLKDLLDMLNRMAANGDLQRWAENVGAAVQGGLEALWQFGVGLVDAWQTVSPWINRAADAVGGFGNAALILIGLNFAGTILGLASGFFQLLTGITMVGSSLLWLAGPLVRLTKIAATLAFGALRMLDAALMAVARVILTVVSFALRYLFVAMQGVIRVAVTMAATLLSVVRGAFVLMGRAALALATGGLRVLAGAISFVGRALLIAGRAAMANPLILALTVLAGIAYVIYQNWDGFVAYFQAKIEAVRAAFDEGLLNGVLKLLSEFNVFRLMYDGAQALFEYLTGWTFADVTAALRSAFDIDFYAIGVAMITSLWDGMKSVMSGLIDWGKSQLASIVPDWMSSGFSSGAIGEGAAPGMGGAMGDGSEFTVPDGQRATGGPVRAGQIYRWNEQGRELFSPTTDGTVINARQTRAMVGGGSRSTSVNLGGVTIHAAPGMSPQDIARAVRREIEEMTRNAGFGLHDGGSYV